MRAHYTENYIINPTHSVTVDLIGAGGTGSQMLQSLTRIDYALFKLGHPGLHVRVFDDDIVTDANIGRQLFSPSDIGRNKAEVLVTRANDFLGNDWEAVPRLYGYGEGSCANITISCVDNVQSRIEIGKHVRCCKNSSYDQEHPYYWMDFGNAEHTGQVIIGTIGKVSQPKCDHETVEKLPCVDEVFDLKKVKDEDSGQSCSLAEALTKQDLFVNSMLCQVGSAILWKVFKGMTTTRGAYVNVDTMQVSPIKV